DKKLRARVLVVVPVDREVSRRGKPAMIGRRILPFVSFFLMALAYQNAAAQVTVPDESCRTNLQKRTMKLGVTSNKAIDACIKAELGYPTGVDCNNAQPGNAVTDIKLK